MQAASYIYILFVLGYIIYSFIKAKNDFNKNKPTVNTDQNDSSDQYETGKPVSPPTASPMPDPGEEVKKMLEQLFSPKQKTEEPVAKKIEVVQKSKPESRKTIQKVSGEVRAAPIKIQVSEKKEKAKLSHTPLKSQKPAKPFLATEQEVHKPIQAKAAVVSEVAEPAFDFDIREAILYSEILKRPQY